MGDPRKNTAYSLNVGLVDQAARPQFKANPTLATGDFKLSIDDDAFANLATLPTVSPATGKAVHIALSSDEMNGDRLVILCSDAAGAEWDDLMIVLTPNVRTVDDVLPTASYTAPANSDVAAIKAKTDQLVFTTANRLDSSVIDKTGFALSAAGVQAIWDALAVAMTTVGSLGKLLVDTLTAAIGSRLASASYTAPDNAGIAAVQAKTDQLAFTVANRVNATAVSVSDKTGYALSSTGLDAVAAPTDLTNDAAARASFVGMFRALFNRFYDKVTQGSGEQIVHNDSNTAISTMDATTDGTTQTKSKSA